MSNVAKLKKQAADFEAKKQFDKALAKYVEVIQAMDQADDEPDVAIFNRVGDLFARQNNVAEAVNYYERAVDIYSDTGLFNNAIALCNKILRVSPGRTSIYYKLGRISAHKGFRADAKQNFLEYADRMRKAGQIDEAFRALKEFADLCPDEDGIRLMLAEQFVKHNRETEALEQLEILYHDLEGEGRSDEAAAALERMKAIDPAYELKERTGSGKRKTSGLVFLDVGDAAAPAPPSRRASGRVPAAADARASRALDSLPLIDMGEPPPEPAPPPRPSKAEPRKEPPRPSAARPAAPPMAAGGIEGISHGAGMDAGATAGAGGTLEGLETGFGFGGGAVAPEAVPGLEIELTGLTPDDAAAAAAEDLTMSGVEPRRPSQADLEMITEAPATDDLPLIEPEPEINSADLILSETGAGAGLGGDIELIDTDASPLHRSSVEMLRDMVPPLLREDDESIPALDVSGLDITPGIDASVTGELEIPSELTPSFGGAGAGGGDLSMFDVDVTLDAPVEEGIDAAALITAEHETPAEGVPADAEGRRGSRATGTTLAISVEALRDRIADEPENWEMHRLLGEALLEAGDREGAMQELESAMLGYERAEDLTSASSIADEIVHLEPDSVRFLQKRVEYAFRTNDRPRLVEAYLGLADGLVKVGQGDKARSVYQRVLDLAPDDLRAQAALESLAPEEAPPPPPPKKEKAGIARRYTAELRKAAPSGPPVPPAPNRPSRGVPAAAPPARASRSGPPVPPPPAARASRAAPAVPAAPAAPRAAAPRPDDEFVNLGDWLRDTESPKDTRMKVEEQEPTGDEEADFADMLRKFKQGVAENVEEEDHESHYDLGVAYKEMGLLDEAVAEFQKALRGTAHRVRTYEALGNCFIEKGQHQVAVTVLSRALSEKGMTDDQLVGVLYLLGLANEWLQKYPEALEYYNRVFAVDIQFRDVGERITTVEQVTQ